MSLFSCKSDDDDDSPTYYTITISSTIENGSVSADKTSAASGTTITLTLSAAEGYEFESLSVTTSGDESLTTTAVTAGTSYTFTMPASSVTVSATFTKTAEKLNQEAADAVIAKINAIGTVAYTDACKALIDDARVAYDALTSDQKALVTNYSTLTTAESSYESLASVPVTAITLSLTSPAVGQVIGSDGKNYAYGSLPTGVTAVAMIAYLNDSNGLALALTDEGQMNWSTAQTTCAAHTPAFTGGTWKLASQDEWNNMISAAGSFSALREGFSSVGGTNMQPIDYWSSTEHEDEHVLVHEDDSDRMYYCDFYDGQWYDGNKDNDTIFVRACLAF